jgi:hypothetical protein
MTAGALAGAAVLARCQNARDLAGSNQDPSGPDVVGRYGQGPMTLLVNWRFQLFGNLLIGPFFISLLG